MQTVDFNNSVQFIIDNKKIIKGIRVTKIERYGFNSMEGNQVAINVKLITNDQHKNKMFTILTNDTYMEDFNRDNEKEDFEEYLNVITMD